MNFINGTGSFLLNATSMGLQQTSRLAGDFIGRSILNLQPNSTATTFLVISATITAFGLIKGYNWIQSKTPKEKQLKAVEEGVRPPIGLDKVFSQAKMTDDSVVEIFARFEPKNLDTMRCVSKICNRVASSKYITKISVINNFSFSAEHWNMTFGEGTVSENEVIGAFKSLPKNIEEILKSPCVRFAKKTKADTHMLFYIPKSIKGESVTLKNLGNLFKGKNEFEKNLNGFRSIHQDILNEFGDIPIESGWYLMSKEITERKDDEDYDELVADLNTLNEKHGTEYKVPKIGEAIIGTYTEYFKSNNRLFTEKPEAFTWCEENVNDSQVMMGGFSSNGVLILAPPSTNDEEGLGIAPLIKL